MQMKILITNIASVTAISITKILKKGILKNIYIIGTEAQKYGYNSGSMLVDYYIQVPSVTDKSYVQSILHICTNYDIDVVIPILDEEIYIFEKSCLRDYVKILLPNIQTICLFRNKMLASERIHNFLPMNVPQIYKNKNAINCDKVIIRKKESIGSQGITIKEKKELSLNDFNDPDCFVQTYIEGTEYTVDILADKHGNIKLIIPRERLQIKNGVSTKVKISKDLEIINLCQKIYDKFCIPGLSNIQFIKQNNNIYFLELNMRFAGMGIASVLASYDYLSDYILYLTSNKNLGNYSDNMEKVKWGVVVCRYYEETVLMQ